MNLKVGDKFKIEDSERNRIARKFIRCMSKNQLTLSNDTTFSTAIDWAYWEFLGEYKVLKFDVVFGVRSVFFCDVDGHDSHNPWIVPVQDLIILLDDDSNEDETDVESKPLDIGISVTGPDDKKLDIEKHVKEVVTKIEAILKKEPNGQDIYQINLQGIYNHQIYDEVTKIYYHAGWKKVVCKQNTHELFSIELSRV